MIAVSVSLTTHDEAANIERTLRAISEFVDETFVDDSDSTDGTLDIACKYGADVVNLLYEHGRIISGSLLTGMADVSSSSM